MIIDSLADAYVWGYPLVAVHRTRARSGTPIGQIAAHHRLATAADRTVVAPNNDTLYSSGWFDLRRGDVIVDVGAMDRPDRYWSVMLLDAYTNVSYVCRRLHGISGTEVRVTLDPHAQPREGTGHLIPMATPTLWVLARVLVEGPADLSAARVAQSAIRIHQHPAEGTDLGPASPSAAPAPTFFAELRNALAIDPPGPCHPPAPPGVDALLRDLPPADLLAEAARRGRTRISERGGADRFGNGWATRSRGADFGTDVAYRAAFAKTSLAGHLPAENRSYSRIIDGRQPVTLRFPPGGQPPARAFWSLTLYGPDLFLVPNALDRFSIGDRTPGLPRAPDGSLTITIGHNQPGDISNWLPAPNGPCVLALRAYEGEAPVVDATWFPPDLELL